MIRYRRLGYVALNVTDLDRSKNFYRDSVGLNVSHSSEDLALLRCSNAKCDLALYKADKAGLRRVAFQAESPAAFQLAQRHLERCGIETHAPQALEAARFGIKRALRLHDPSGIELEIFDEMNLEPTPYEPGAVKIARLGHCVIGSLSVEADLAFYTSVLGFKVSDQIDGAMYFLRCHPSPLHHSFGVAKRDYNGLHHVNFMVTDIDDIGRGRNRLLDNGVNIAFGPGRHLPSDSIFLYFNDPDGLMLEWSFGMEEFAEHDPRPPRKLERDPFVLDMWGGRPGRGYA